MKLPFRAAILGILITLILTTLATVGISSHVYARLAAADLSKQILEQVSLGIDRHVERLISNASERSRMAARLLETGHYSQRDLNGLLQFWAASLEASPGLTSSFIGLAKTGEAAGVSRLEDGRLSIWQTTADSSTGSLRLKEFWLPDYPNSPFRESSGNDAPDIRGRPWFTAAQRAGRSIWTETYVFLGVGKIKHVLGLTYAIPILDRDRHLESVISVDLDLAALCGYLKGLDVGGGGFAYIVEKRKEGLRVVAHPRPELLTLSSERGPFQDPQLVPIESIRDGRIRAMLDKLDKVNFGKDNPKPTSVRFDFEGENYLGTFHVVSGNDKPHWIICTVLPEEEILGFAHQANRSTLLVTLGAMIIAILIGVYVSGQVARPLEHLASEAAKVGHLRLAAQPVAHSFVLEVDRLAVASEEMKSGLRSFRKYVPAELVRRLIDSGQDARLGGERRWLTIFFSDIENFTTISENSNPEALVEQLSDYFDIFNREILANAGTIDKYIGDSVMAFWGAPEPVANHASAACLTAIRIQQQLAEIRSKWRESNKPVLITRIGIHTGDVLVGNIGNESRMNYTVVGDAVNLASRLEGMNKHFGTGILISEDTYREASHSIEARPLGQVNVKGRVAPVTVYELIVPRVGADDVPVP